MLLNLKKVYQKISNIIVQIPDQFSLQRLEIILVPFNKGFKSINELKILFLQ